jgi:hypothetical protein
MEVSVENWISGTLFGGCLKAGIIWRVMGS